MTKVNDLHRKWIKNKEYRKAYEEFAPARAVYRCVSGRNATRFFP